MAKTDLYRIDVLICATAYIKASSRKHARSIAQKLEGKSVCNANQDEPEIPFSGLAYNDPELPAISLSPAMTCYGAFPGAFAHRAND